MTRCLVVAVRAGVSASTMSPAIVTRIGGAMRPRILVATMSTQLGGGRGGRCSGWRELERSVSKHSRRAVSLGRIALA